MGNEQVSILNLAEKTQTRYDLSPYSFRTLQRDHIRFMHSYAKKFPNGFINRIVEYYLNYAVESDIDGFEKGIVTYLKDRSQNSSFYYQENEHRVSLNKPVKKQLAHFEFFDNDYFTKRATITYILEKYTELPLAERERVFCYNHYKTIRKCIDKNEVMLLTHANGKQFEVSPYMLTVDDNSYSYYLIGFSKEKGTDSDYSCHAFKLSRIIECSSKHRSVIIPSKTRRETDAIVEKFGAAYMMAGESVEKALIKLTERGYNELYLKIIAHQRPIPVEEPKLIQIEDKKYYLLSFDCSHRQIRNYFFSFGAEAEVLEPESLRQWFINDYQSSIDVYEHNEENT